MTDQERASFARMTEASAEDMALFYTVQERNVAQFPARLLSMLALLADKYDGSPIDSYAHSLQSATLAYEDDADDETVFIALFHDTTNVRSTATIKLSRQRSFCRWCSG